MPRLCKLRSADRLITSPAKPAWGRGARAGRPPITAPREPRQSGRLCLQACLNSERSVSVGKVRGAEKRESSDEEGGQGL